MLLLIGTVLVVNALMIAAAASAPASALVRRAIPERHLIVLQVLAADLAKRAKRLAGFYNCVDRVLLNGRTDITTSALALQPARGVLRVNSACLFRSLAIRATDELEVHGTCRDGLPFRFVVRHDAPLLLPFIENHCRPRGVAAASATLRENRRDITALARAWTSSRGAEVEDVLPYVLRDFVAEAFDVWEASVDADPGEKVLVEVLKTDLSTVARAFAI